MGLPSPMQCQRCRQTLATHQYRTLQRDGVTLHECLLCHGPAEPARALMRASVPLNSLLVDAVKRTATPGYLAVLGAWSVAFVALQALLRGPGPPVFFLLFYVLAIVQHEMRGRRDPPPPLESGDLFTQFSRAATLLLLLLFTCGPAALGAWSAGLPGAVAGLAFGLALAPGLLVLAANGGPLRVLDLPSLATLVSRAPRSYAVAVLLSWCALVLGAGALALGALLASLTATMGPLALVGQAVQAALGCAVPFAYARALGSLLWEEREALGLPSSTDATDAY